MDSLHRTSTHKNEKKRVKRIRKLYELRRRFVKRDMVPMEKKT